MLESNKTKNKKKSKMEIEYNSYKNKSEFRLNKSSSLKDGFSCNN